MKNIILALVFLLVSSVSYASWDYLGTDDSGIKYYINSETIQGYGAPRSKDALPPTVQIEVKLDDPNNDKEYSVVDLYIYDSAWVQSKHVTLYDRKTGKAIVDQDFPNNPREKIESGSQNAGIANILLAKYKDKIKEGGTVKKEPVNTVSDDTVTIRIIVVVIMLIVGPIIYFVEKKKK